MTRKQIFRPMIVWSLLASLLLLASPSQAQKGGDKSDLTARKVESITLKPGQPVVRLTAQEDGFLFGDLFPAGLRIPAGESVDSEPVEVGGLNRVSIRMIADSSSPNLQVIVFVGPLPSGTVAAIADDEIADFGRSAFLNLDIPVRGQIMVVRLRNAGFSSRSLEHGASIYGVR